ncbi:MAG: LamG domain-containing protein, partial [Planctomycetota bacterium]
MCRRLSCVIVLVVVLGLVSSASAGIQLKVDIADGYEDEPRDKTYKGGDWTEWAFWGDDLDDQGHDGVFITGFAGLDVNIGFCVENGSSNPGSRIQVADNGEEPICNTWLESTTERSADAGWDDGDIHLVIMGRDLTAGTYRVYAYHNQPHDAQGNMPYIHVGTYCDANALDNLPVPSSNDCTGIVQIHDGETIDEDVPIQSLNFEDGLDSSLNYSLVKFTSDGNSSALIKYHAAFGDTAIVNAFIIELATEPVMALYPDPEVGADDANLCDLQLSWKPGIWAQDANAHHIYLDPNDKLVTEANISEPCGVLVAIQDRDANTYPAVGGLNLKVDTTYYWRVDEVNDACSPYVWKGPIWSFTTHDGKVDNPEPEDNFRGFKPSDVNKISWKPPCAADTHKVYFGVDLPEYIDLFDDGFEDGFDPNWVSSGWELVDANKLVPKDMNLCHGPNVSAYATGAGLKTLTSAEANLADACNIDVEFFFRKTKETRIVDGEVKLYYWDGGGWDYIVDLNTLDPCTDKWIHYSDDINVLDEYHLQTDFKIKLEANITNGGTVYVDDARIRNTWPAAPKWFKGREDSNTFPVSLEPLRKYYWRIDTVMDDGNRVETGDVVQGDWWTFSTGVGGLIMWCTFDGGAVGQPFPSTYQADTDTGRTIEFTKYTDLGGWVKYGGGNPLYNSTGTSVNFDPNAGLYRLDPCLPEESRIEGVRCIDPLRLDGYQYTIEMWVKPTNLSEDEMDDQVLITKGGDSDEDDNGDEWEAGEWGVILLDPGTHEDDENNFIWSHPYGGLQVGEGAAVQDEWCHIAAVYNKEHPDEEKQYSAYYNGVLVGHKRCPGFNSADANSPVSIGFGLDNDANFAERNNYFFGMIDELRIYDIALKPYEFLLTPGPEWASYPRPFYGQVGVEPNDPNLALMWNPGTKAVSHKVYLSTDFQDVNIGNPSALIGTYDTNEANDVNQHLAVGRIYYWRVDEVN